MADLSEIKSVARDIVIVHPSTKQPVGLTVTMVSLDDETLAADRRKITDRRLWLEQRGKHLKAEDIEENQNNLLFKGAKGWEWTLDADGKLGSYKGEQLEFNRVNFMTVISDLKWIRQQLSTEFAETEDFFGN